MQAISKTGLYVIFGPNEWIASKDEWVETKGSAYVSKLGRQALKKLFEMVSLYHTRNECFCGTFDHRDII